LSGDVGFNRHTGIQAMVTKDGGGCKGGKIGVHYNTESNPPKGQCTQGQQTVHYKNQWVLGKNVVMYKEIQSGLFCESKCMEGIPDI